MKYLKRAQKAENLTIDIFGDLTQKIKNHKPVQFKSWLYTTAKNPYLMLLRKNNGNNTSIDDQFEKTAGEDSLSSKELLETKLEALEIVLKKLNEKQAFCLKAVYLEKLCCQEISKAHWPILII